MEEKRLTSSFLFSSSRGSFLLPGLLLVPPLYTKENSATKGT
jgi:hypothetical protein